MNEEDAIKLLEEREEQKRQDADLHRRRREDFNFLVLCNMKGNMAMYDLLRDRSLK